MIHKLSIKFHIEKCGIFFNTCTIHFNLFFVNMSFTLTRRNLAWETFHFGTTIVLLIKFTLQTVLPAHADHMVKESGELECTPVEVT